MIPMIPYASFGYFLKGGHEDSSSSREFFKTPTTGSDPFNLVKVIPFIFPRLGIRNHWNHTRA